jgi:hypothetical protein
LYFPPLNAVKSMPISAAAPTSDGGVLLRTMDHTADVQYIDSALTGANRPGVGPFPAVNLPGPKEAWVVGVRTNLDF